MGNNIEELKNSPAFFSFGKKITVIGVIASIAGGVMKLSGIQYGDYLLIMGLVTLALTAYLILSNLPYKPIEKDEDANARLRPIWNFSIKLLGWGLSVLLIGFLFWLYHWPGWEILLIVGAITTPIGVITMLFYLHQRNKYQIY